MSKTVSAFVGVLAATAASAGLLTMAGDAFAPAVSASSTSCIVPRGSGPGYNASIGNQQNNKTICITVGTRLLVVLSAPEPSAPPWRQVHVSKTGILNVAPLTLMFSRGATGTNFKSVHLGTVVLTAERPVCAPVPSGAATCDAIQLWRATVIVRASSIALPKPPGTGVYGLVTASPTCAVERVGQPCPARPVVAEVDLRGPSGKTVEATHTGSAGQYAMSVKPGKYTLVVKTGTTFPRCPIRTITVASGTALRADIGCDTGIR